MKSFVLPEGVYGLKVNSRTESYLNDKLNGVLENLPNVGRSQDQRDAVFIFDGDRPSIDQSMYSDVTLISSGDFVLVGSSCDPSAWTLYPIHEHAALFVELEEADIQQNIQVDDSDFPVDPKSIGGFIGQVAEYLSGDSGCDDPATIFQRSLCALVGITGGQFDFGKVPTSINTCLVNHGHSTQNTHDSFFELLHEAGASHLICESQADKMKATLLNNCGAIAVGMQLDRVGMKYTSKQFTLQADQAVAFLRNLVLTKKVSGKVSLPQDSDAEDDEEDSKKKPKAKYVDVFKPSLATISEINSNQFDILVDSNRASESLYSEFLILEVDPQSEHGKEGGASHDHVVQTIQAFNRERMEWKQHLLGQNPDFHRAAVNFKQSDVMDKFEHDCSLKTRLKNMHINAIWSGATAMAKTLAGYFAISEGLQTKNVDGFIQSFVNVESQHYEMAIEIVKYSRQLLWNRISTSRDKIKVRAMQVYSFISRSKNGICCLTDIQKRFSKATRDRYKMNSVEIGECIKWLEGKGYTKRIGDDTSRKNEYTKLAAGDIALQEHLNEC